MSNFVNLNIGYHLSTFQISWLSGSVLRVSMLQDVWIKFYRKGWNPSQYYNEIIKHSAYRVKYKFLVKQQLFLSLVYWNDIFTSF